MLLEILSNILNKNMPVKERRHFQHVLSHIPLEAWHYTLFVDKNITLDVGSGAAKAPLQVLSHMHGSALQSEMC